MDDPDFDLEYHVRRVVFFPQPGSMEQLWAEAARLWRRAADLAAHRGRSTWIEWGVDGVDGTTQEHAVMRKVLVTRYRRSLGHREDAGRH